MSHLVVKFSIFATSLNKCFLLLCAVYEFRIGSVVCVVSNKNQSELQSLSFPPVLRCKEARLIKSLGCSLSNTVDILVLSSIPLQHYSLHYIYTVDILVTSSIPSHLLIPFLHLITDRTDPTPRRNHI